MKFFRKHIVENEIISVLKIPPFSYMMISEFFSQLAFNMQHFILIVVIYKLTHSNTAVSGLILSLTIPSIVFSLFSGVLVDRWNKKKVLFFSNLLRGFIILPFLIYNLHIGIIYFLTFLIAIATQFFIPAESSIIPSLVPRRLIFPANAVFSLGIYGTILFGYILAGPMLLALGRENSILLLSLFFFISTFIILAIKVPKNKEYNVRIVSGVKQSFARDIKEIFSFIRSANKVLHSLIILVTAQAVMFIFAVLGPGYVSTVLKVGIENISLVLIAPAGLGIGLGGIFLGSMGKRYKAKTLSVVGFLATGIVLVLFPSTRVLVSTGFISAINLFLPHVFYINILHLAVVLAFVVGFSISLIFIPSNATIQMETGEHMRGRIYGFLNALVGAVSVLPIVIAGGLADLIGVGTVIVSIGIILVIISGLVFFFD